jgi:acyl-coenzyme A thioesterase PaaI-like protein
MINWPKPSVDTSKDFDMCFACGQRNPIGLKLKFTKEGEGVRTEFTPGESHQGWSGVIHGGIIGCILDEAMSYAALFVGVSSLTAKMQTRFRHPVRVGEQLIITARVTKKTKRLLETEAEMHLKDGTPVADSTATMFTVGQEAVKGQWQK